MSRLLSTVLAHQGGWDEILLIAGPIVVIAGLLLIAKKRVDDAHASGHADRERPEAGHEHGDRQGVGEAAE